MINCELNLSYLISHTFPFILPIGFLFCYSSVMMKVAKKYATDNVFIASINMSNNNRVGFMIHVSFKSEKNSSFELPIDFKSNDMKSYSSIYLSDATGKKQKFKLSRIIQQFSNFDPRNNVRNFEVL